MRIRLAIITGALALTLGGLSLRANGSTQIPSSCGGPCPTTTTTQKAYPTTTTTTTLPATTTTTTLPPNDDDGTTTTTTVPQSTTSTTIAATSTTTSTTTTVNAPVITAIKGPATVSVPVTPAPFGLPITK